MANRRKDELREIIIKLNRETDLTFQEIAEHEDVQLPGRQWVYYYLVTNKDRDEI